jgi:hypothetical protein
LETKRSSKCAGHTYRWSAADTVDQNNIEEAKSPGVHVCELFTQRSTGKFSKNFVKFSIKIAFFRKDKNEEFSQFLKIVNHPSRGP